MPPGKNHNEWGADLRDYRPGVVVVLTGSRPGSLLLFHRAGWPPETGWQFPQGGVDPGLPLIEEARRELREEIGASVTVHVLEDVVDVSEGLLELRAVVGFDRVEHAHRPEPLTLVGAAQDAGFRGVLVRTGKFSEGDLDDAEPDLVLDSVAELVRAQ